MLWPATAAGSLRTRGKALGASAAVHALVIAAIFSVTFPETVRRVRYQATPIFAPAAEARPPARVSRPAPRPKRLVAAAPSRPAAIVPELPAPTVVSVAPAVSEQALPAPVIEAPRPAPPPSAVFATDSYQAAASVPNRAPALQAVPEGFSALAVSAAAPLPAVRHVSTGGFGETTAARTLTGGSGTTRTAGGFGSMTAAAVAPPAKVPRSGAQFDTVTVKPAAAPSGAQVSSAGVLTPLEIFQKPRPAYSEEARRLQLEGEVVIEVLFRANGQIRVTRLIHGLGHGLDENAIQAAGGIRFRPATENGSPVNTVAVVRIAFQLAY